MDQIHWWSHKKMSVFFHEKTSLKSDLCIQTSRNKQRSVRDRFHDKYLVKFDIYILIKLADFIKPFSLKL